MRLLDTSSYELTEFLGDKIPPYVILSHTWGEEEVLFPDIQNKTAQSKKKGFNKLVGCCQKAVEDGFKWVWIDTCCIDKSSSAELSEAINSMYQWYRDSTICYAYLEDVMDVLQTPGTSSKHFTESRWFTRGWTLQELIAPRTVEFYTLYWQEIGTKTSLGKEIAAATGIPADILRGEDVSTRTIAERMSWASKRQTTRREDMAYCLMGLFQINMPLLYGEGAKSFMRLQEQILRQEEDYSILAWTPQEGHDQMVLKGCLASSPSQFGTVPRRLLSTEFDKRVRVRQRNGRAAMATYGNIKSFFDIEESRLMETKSYERFRKARPDQYIMPMDPPQLTARGLRISLPMRHINVRARSGQVLLQLAWIYCEVDKQLVCVLLDPVMTGSTAAFARLPLPWLVSVDKSLLSEFKLTELFLSPSDSKMNFGFLELIGTLENLRVRLELSPAAGYRARVVSASPVHLWELDGFRLESFPDTWIVLMMECKRDGQDTAAHFEVGCGMSEANLRSLSDRILLCSIREFLGPGTMNGAVEDVVQSGRRRLTQPFKDTTSDRAAKASTKIPGMVVWAAIRPRPQNGLETSQFILRVTVGELASCDRWAQVYARQEIARIQGEAGTRP